MNITFAGDHPKAGYGKIVYNIKKHSCWGGSSPLEDNGSHPMIARQVKRSFKNSAFRCMG
jgi:hypothetical protein